jgi:ribosomal protein S18 acetylase RimI-like enzyme
MAGVAEIVPFEPHHLGAVLALCEAEGWPSLPADPEKARRALRAPGVTTCVALDVDRVVGFAQLLSDGEIQSYLSVLLVAPGHRGRGVGHALVRACARRAGGVRVDLLAESASRGFYESFPHRGWTGYRIYPLARDTPASDAGA